VTAPLPPIEESLSTLAAFDGPPKPRVVIVGSGFSGLCMGIRLKQAGIDSFTIVEKAGALGGTWRDNDYPGAACDVQSHLYSFSFELNPRWSRMFAEQGEIRSYLEYCAEKYGLVRHLRFNREVERAEFDQASRTWTVTLVGG
jgi:cation diffusion facilitator CzcD-associated flavoprotein CzcO